MAKRMVLMLVVAVAVLGGLAYIKYGQVKTAIAMGATHVRVGSALFGHRVPGSRFATGGINRGAQRWRSQTETLPCQITLLPSSP